jgi:hypothetical protein
MGAGGILAEVARGFPAKESDPEMEACPYDQEYHDQKGDRNSGVDLIVENLGGQPGDVGRGGYGQLLA